MGLTDVDFDLELSLIMCVQTNKHTATFYDYVCLAIINHSLHNVPGAN